jgi:hypothetical protein
MSAYAMSMLLSEYVLTDEQLKAVGCLALEATRLETHLEQAILDHCGSVMGKLLLDRNKMLDAKLDLFRDIFIHETLSDEHAKELEKLYADIKIDIPRRNTVIHGSWEDPAIRNFLALANNPQRNATAYKKSVSMKASDVMDLAYRFGFYQLRLVDWYMQVVEYHDAKRVERGEPLQ